VKENSMLRSPLRPAQLAAAFVLLGAAVAAAQTPPPATVVLTTLTIRADAARPQIMKTMPDEVRATVKLYLDGKIQQWYARTDGRGVVFILNCTTVAEAKALVEELPLSKASLATFEFVPLGPLTPLRMLLTEPATPPAR